MSHRLVAMALLAGLIWLSADSGVRLVRNLAIDDARLSSLGHRVVETTGEGGQQGTAIKAWVKDDTDWVDDWQTGKPGDR